MGSVDKVTFHFGGCQLRKRCIGQLLWHNGRVCALDHEVKGARPSDFQLFSVA